MTPGPRKDAAPPSAFLAAFAQWAERPRPSAEMIAMSGRYALMRRRDDTAFGRALAVAKAGDAGRGAELAIAAILSEDDGPVREAHRAVAAVMAAGADEDAAQALFDARAGWRPDRPFSAAAAILFVAVRRGCQPWHEALLDRCRRDCVPKQKPAAISARIALAARIGATRETLADLIGQIARLPGSPPKAAIRMASLLHMSGRRDLFASLLDASPALRSAARQDAVAAHLVAEVEGVSLLDEPARSTAGRLVALEQDNDAFWRRMARPQARIAVVGNSPCEIGRDRGAEIDAHDVVMRFNGAPDGGEHAADYGARCDVRMMSGSLFDASAEAFGGPVVAMRQAHLLQGGLAYLDRAAALGRTLVFLSGVVEHRLAAELAQVPSSGLTALAQLREARGSLSGVSCFGFSMVDLLADSSAGHYFGAAGPGSHAWRAERALLDGWLAGR